MLQKLFRSKFGVIYVVVVLVAVNLLASLIHYRIDLTRENRFTLSAPTQKLLRNLNDKIQITVFLDGELPAGFRKLRNSTEELLREFKENGGSSIQYQFQKIGDGLEEEAKTAFLDSMARLGIKPYTVKVQAKADEGNEERQVVPGALITYKGRPLAINLLSGQMTGSLDEATINSTEALLEYKFAHAIQKVSEEQVPSVGYLLGNGETFSPNIKSLVETVLMPNYQFRFLPIDSFPLIPLNFDALLIMKPTIPFREDQKLKIDQYIMHGGKVIWLVDRLYAEMDSLLRKQSDFVAFDRNLNLEDQLFKYGVRINPDLVQDLQCDKFPLVVGSVGDQPQIDLVDWPYFPLLDPQPASPITSNLGKVLSVFPNSVDTIKTPGIKKTILLTGSANGRSLITPAIVSFNSVKTQEDLKTFNRPHIPVAVLLEGAFPSLYSNRLTQSYQDSLKTLYNQPFRSNSVSTKMVVISDADIVSNVVTQQDGPLEMGVNQFTKANYANKDFILNTIEYLVNPTGIMETRAKDYTLRLLDTKKLENGRNNWTLINIGLPVLLVVLFGLVFQTLRRRKYNR